jgi:hypothetical protein
MVSVFAHPQAALSASQIACVIPCAGDAESLREPPRTAGKFDEVFWAVDFNASGFSHFFYARNWFQGPDQNASRLAFRLAGNIEAVMISVNEVHVGVTGRSEQYGGAGGVSGGRMGGSILDAKVSFGFNDASRERGLRFLPNVLLSNQHLAQKFTRHPAWIATEKSAIQRTNLQGLLLLLVLRLAHQAKF